MSVLAARPSSYSLPALSLRHFTPKRRFLATIAQPSIRCVRPSRKEKEEGKLTQRNMQAALEALHIDGIVVLESVINESKIDALNVRMKRDTKTLMERGSDGPFNYNLGNLQQSPPYEVKSLCPEIFFNPLATSVTKALLGGKPTMSFISSNAAVKAEVGQPVHVDADFDHPKIPFAAVVNVGLTDMNPKNGSTELWLGTHRDTTLADQEGSHGERASGRVRQARLEERKRVVPPMQPHIKKGSVVIRDLRLWHAGMPNTTDEIRIMLAMIHFAPWYRQRMSLKLPAVLQGHIDAASRFANLDVPATYSDEHVDHLQAQFGNAFDFNQDL